jgi:hypothetical protein
MLSVLAGGGLTAAGGVVSPLDGAGHEGNDTDINPKIVRFNIGRIR